MRFAIRDDDTNFFTSPAELNFAYGEVWDICPPSLSVITHVKGNWKFWVDEIYKRRSQTDWDTWRKDDTIYPISDNTELVAFLKNKIKEGKLVLTFHAIYHRNHDEVLPGNVANNYVQGAEFYTNRDLSSELSAALTYVNKTFETEVNVFTPPQNLLSMQGYQAVLKNRLNIVGGGISFLKKEKNVKGLLNIARQAYYKMLGKEYPYVLRYATHTELPYHYPLQPDTTFEQLKAKFDQVKTYDGDFVLSTHYNEFSRLMTYDHTQQMKDVFMRFFAYAKQQGVVFMSLNEMLAR